ncbi:uncharacterized protein [Rutidosis leptorrhynchoides]|uniref:uncharacterized protein n=1 Tax=Rutidosis leptorrhynchoides TaxID=125765 RepID=UPI003A99F33D
MHFDYAWSLARGLFGGIISLWDPSIFLKSNIWCDDNYVIVKGTWLKVNIETFMVNVYAPQALSNKVILWNKLSNFMMNNPGHFIFMGDWNSVRSRDDVCGSHFCSHDARLFNDFIEPNHLYEVPLCGVRYMYRNKAGTKLSKLDIFFITSNVLDSIDDFKGLVLDRGYSDHAPILLFQDKVDFGPAYFKIFDSWFERPNFESFVRTTWSSLGNGSADSSTTDRQNALFLERDELLKREATDMIQKSRVKWDVEGDENSKFFHCSLKRKHNYQNINGLMVDGSWVSDPFAIKQLFFDHFKSKFDSFQSGAEFLHTDPTYKLSQEEADYLECDIDDVEIKRAV